MTDLTIDINAIAAEMDRRDREAYPNANIMPSQSHYIGRAIEWCDLIQSTGHKIIRSEYLEKKGE